MMVKMIGQKMNLECVFHLIIIMFSLQVHWMAGLSGRQLFFFIIVTNSLTLCLHRIHHFADIYAKKLSLKREALIKTLWGDYYFDKKTKRVHKGAQVRLLALIEHDQYARL